MADHDLKSVVQACGLVAPALIVCAITGCTAGRHLNTDPSIIVDRSSGASRELVTNQTDDRVGLPQSDRQIGPLQLDTTKTAPSDVQVVSFEPTASPAGDWVPESFGPTPDGSAFHSRFVPVVDVSPSVGDSPPPAVAAISDSWNLQALQNLALRNNPAIQQAGAAASQADGVHNQTGLWPNPTMGYFADEIGNEGKAGLNGLLVSQTFVRGDKLAWNQRVVGHEVQIRRWHEKAQRQRVLTDVQLHYVTALAAQQRLELTRAFRKVAEQGVRISEQRVEGGFAGLADVLQSEIQLSQIELAIQQTELQLDAAWQQLAAVVGLPDLARRSLHDELETDGPPTNFDDVLPQLLAESPLLAAAQYQVSRARANLRRQQVQKTPNLTAQLRTGHDDATGDAFASLQFSVPVPVHNRNQGNVHAASAAYCKATQNVRRLKMQIRHDLAAEIRDYQSAQAAVEQYRDVILPKAKETLKLMKQAQAGGEYDFLRVLTARRAFYDAGISYVKARQISAVAAAKIEGRLLTGGLSQPVETPLSTGLRSQALSQQ